MEIIGEWEANPNSNSNPNPNPNLLRNLKNTTTSDNIWNFAMI